MTFRQWEERARRPANTLVGLGLEKRDRVAILAHNAVEWMEIYAATANAGLVMVPINFRLVGTEIGYIVEDGDAKALLVQHDLVGAVEDIRKPGVHAPGQKPVDHSIRCSTLRQRGGELAHL